MTSESIDWDEDLPGDPEEEYQTFVRTLERTEGFRLLFVRCTPVEGKQLIARVKEDIPQKTIEVLHLDEPIDNLYEIIEHLPNLEQINILFIQGLEHSFYEYENNKLGDTSEREFYDWKGVPQILNHLNQQRERFRDNFNICFIFLLRSFSIKYFIHRAPDFFDWRSSVFEFPTEPELLEQESTRLLQEGNYGKYLLLTPEERIQKILEIQELLEENHQTSSYRASLLFELGNLLSSSEEYEAAIANYEQALKFKSDYHQAWNNRGIALRKLGRYEEAIANYDQAFKFKSDYSEAWYNRGIALENLGRYEEAITNYDEALKFQPDYHEAWYNRGIALENLGRSKEAISSYEQALKFQPDYHSAWSNWVYGLDDLGRWEEAITSCDKAIEFKPDFSQALYNREEERNPIAKSAGELERNWRTRLLSDYPDQNPATRRSIIRWLLGEDLERFDTLSPDQLEIAKQAMDYRYLILRQRYLGMPPGRGYRNLMTRLASLVTLRNKIRTWVSLSRDRQRAVVDVLQEVIQELLNSDRYIHKQIAWIEKCTQDISLREALLFTSIEEYCLRPIRDQPLLVYRFVNFLRRSERGGVTDVMEGDTVRLVSELVTLDNELVTLEDIDASVSLLDNQAIADYLDAQAWKEQQTLRKAVRQEFEEYLTKNLGKEAAQWLRLYLEGQSQEAIARALNKPIKDIYRLREKITYHAIRVFSIKEKQELVAGWLETP